MFAKLAAMGALFTLGAGGAVYTANDGAPTVQALFTEARNAEIVSTEPAPVCQLMVPQAPIGAFETLTEELPPLMQQPVRYEPAPARRAKPVAKSVSPLK